MIAAGDVIGLEEAIDESDDYPNTIYTIYLEEGEYLLPRTLVVSGTVKIYGAGVDTTILRQVGIPGTQPGSMNTMIKVPGIALTLDNVTLRDGYSYYAGGAIALENEAGTLTVTNARFVNNRVHQPPAPTGLGMGGAIYSGGTMYLERVYFQDNVAPFGGALASFAPPNGGFRGVLEYIDFKDNFGAVNAGAVYIGAGKGDLKIRNSNFRRNASNALPPAAIPQHAFSHTPETGIVNAKKNYWNNPSVPSSATNDYGVNTLEQLSAKVDIEFDPPAQVPVSATKTPTPTVQFATATPSQGLSNWYVTNANLTTDLVVRQSPSKFSDVILPYAARCSEIQRVDLLEYDDPDSNVTRVKIHWPRGTSQVGYVAIRDGDAPQDGDYLVPQYAELVGPPHNCPQPTATPTATATHDPNMPIVSPGRLGTYDDQSLTITSFFDTQAPATIGAFGVHVGTIDLVPRNFQDGRNPSGDISANLEHCTDTLVSSHQYLCDGVDVYSALDGWLYRDYAEFIIMGPGDGSLASVPEIPYPVRTELVLAHIDYATINPTIQQGVWTTVSTGTFIGRLCNSGDRIRCNLLGEAPNHLAVEFRFNPKADNLAMVRPQDSEIVGFIASPNCLYDNWKNVPGLETPQDNPIHGCP